MKLKPSAILFDMDGVLVDSMDSWLMSLNAALKAYNHKPVSRMEFIEKYWGHDLYDNLDRMGLEHEIGGFCNQIYHQHVNQVRIYPDTRSTLEKLNGYKKGVITNTPKDSALAILKTFNIEQYFETVITSDQVTKAKPDPEIVYKACEILHVKPENTVLIGDTESDVKAGKAAGCTVIGVKTKADYIITNLSDLLKLLSQ